MSIERRLLALVLGGLVLVGLALLAAWFFKNYERGTESVPVAASAAARRNPFLAAERFLVRLGIPAESRPGRELLRRPPPVTDTLVVRGLGGLNAAHTAALRAWIAAGGRLLVEPAGPPDRDPRPGELLEAFGIRLVKVPNPEGDDPEQALGRLRPDGGGAALQLAFDPDVALHVEGELGVRVRADGYTRLVRLPVGAGVLTVVSDQGFLANDQIGRQDHALALARLVRPASGGKVWLLYDPVVPGLWALLWQTVPGALAAAGLALLVWAWSLGARLGPLVQPPGRARRDLIEHLDAAGAFLWRHGRAAGLTEGTRREVLATWQRRRPELRHLPPAGQAAIIAAAVGLPAEAVTAALATAAHDPRTCVEHTRLLQTLSRAAGPGAPSPSLARPPSPPHQVIDYQRSPASVCG